MKILCQRDVNEPLSSVGEKQIRTTVEIFLLRKDARTRQRYSVGVGREGLPSLGTGLLCPLTARKIKNLLVQVQGEGRNKNKKAY